MFRVVYTLMLVFVCILKCNGQTAAIEELKKAHDLWLSLENQLAFEIYQRVIEEFPNNKIALMEAYYRSGVILEINQQDSSKVYFEKMIALPFTEEEKHSVDLKTFMHRADDPYRQYMHLAYSYLGDIAQSRKEYHQALTYYRISNEEFPSWDQRDDFSQLFSVECYAECYAGLQKPDSVLYTLLPYSLISRSYAAEGLSSLKKNLRLAGEIPDFAKQLNAALSAFTLKEELIGETYAYQFWITLLGKPLLIDIFYAEDSLSSIQKQQKLDSYHKKLAFAFRELAKKE